MSPHVGYKVGQRCSRKWRKSRVLFKSLCPNSHKIHLNIGKRPHALARTSIKRLSQFQMTTLTNHYLYIPLYGPGSYYLPSVTFGKREEKKEIYWDCNKHTHSLSNIPLTSPAVNYFSSSHWFDCLCGRIIFIVTSKSIKFCTNDDDDGCDGKASLHKFLSRPWTEAIKYWSYLCDHL